MKELSIEEKAKAYDKVVSKLKGFMIQGVDPLITRADVQDFFPELKESEGERIRKTLIAVVNLYYGEGEDEEKTACLYWLEKQGEYNKFRDSIQVGDKVTRNEEGVLVNLSQLNRVAKKQGEQKPVPKFKIGDTMRTLQEAANGVTDGMPVVVSIDEEYYHCTNEKIAIRDQDDYEYPPMNRRQKTVGWSEEDKKRLSDIIVFVSGYATKEVNKEWVNWLKSLKDRVQPQPKQEWSGGDEAHLHSLITHLEQWIERHPNTTGADIQGENITWLKSLRPQSTWKPSEEQIAVLNEVINYAANSELQHWSDFIYTLLKSLREQLKKLREE